MKYKNEVSDSGGNSKSPSKRTAKNRNPSAQSLTGDSKISDGFNVTERSSVQESHDEIVEEPKPNDELATQNQPNEVSIVEISKNTSSPEKPVSVKSIFTVEDLSPDDEIYTLQCPQSCNKQELINKNLDFTKMKPSLTNKGEVYQLQFLYSDKKFITLAVPKSATNGSLMKLPLKGHIVIKEGVDICTVEPMVDDDCDKDRVKYPDDIKVRHPLLGIDWKAHMDLADTAFVSYNTIRKKNKKRKKEKSEDENIVEIKKIKEESSESEFGTPKKKRKIYDL